MNWDDLKLFLAVARSGSISGAAKTLDVQHSTVSRRIKKFEESMEARIFKRTPTGFKLTDEGKKIEEAAKKIEAEIILIDDQLSGSDHQLSGMLKVSTLNNMASTILMPIFAKFMKSQPEIELHILVSNKDVSLPQREADIAIRLTNNPPETLIGKRILSVASAVYGHKNIVKDKSLLDLTDQWLGVECCGFHRTWTKKASPNTSHKFYSDDTLVTLAALKAELGISCLPCFMGDVEPDLIRVTSPIPENDLGLWLLYHHDLKNSGKIKAFKQFILKELIMTETAFNGTA